MKTVIEMAREANIKQAIETPHLLLVSELERFAELVRADERNRVWTQDHWTEYERSIAAAEREACARVCDEQVERSKEALAKAKRVTDQAVYRSGAQTSAWNAAAIRARGNK